MENMILFLVAMFVLAGCTVFAIFSGLAKSRIRGICVIASAVLAVGMTLIFQSNFGSEEFINETMIPWLQNEIGFAEAADLSQEFYEVLFNCVSAMAGPVLLLVFFLIFSLVFWIIYLIITLILSEALRNQNMRAAARLPRAIVWGVVQGLVVLTVLVLPVSCYLEIAPNIADAVLKTELVEGEAADALSETMETVVDPLNEGAALVGYRALGGNALTKLLTGFEIAGEKTYLADEIDALAEFSCRLYALTKTHITEYGDREADIFVAIADSFEESALLSKVTGELVWGATDAWQKGKTFIGVGKPVLDGDIGQVTTPFMNTLVEVLHDDARDIDALTADLHTVADVISILARREVFAAFDNTEELIAVLSRDGVTEELIETLEKNESMSVLADEITDMGMRAIALMLTMEDIEDNYGEFLGETATALNNIKTMSEEEQVAELSKQLGEAFEKAEVPIDASIVDKYSQKMVDELIIPSGDKELTEDDVKDYFLSIYDEAADDIGAKAGDLPDEIPAA